MAGFVLLALLGFGLFASAFDIFGGDDEDTNNSVKAGTSGDDTLSSDRAGEVLSGGAGNDLLTVSGGATAEGGTGDDTISAVTGAANGGEGNDRIIAVNGTATGGNGSDTIGAVGSEVFGDAGDDHLFLNDVREGIFADSASMLFGGEGDDTLNSFGSSNAFQDSLYGGAGDDSINSGRNDVGFGGEGDDTLLGATLFGGTGSDNLTVFFNGTGEGGEGNDQITVGDSATGLGGEGDDTITFTDEGYGEGGNGDDTFIARGGNSTILGGNGNDYVFVTEKLETGGKANVFAAGGDGSDVFHIRNAVSDDPTRSLYIPDFNADEDIIVFDEVYRADLPQDTPIATSLTISFEVNPDNDSLDVIATADADPNFNMRVTLGSTLSIDPDSVRVISSGPSGTNWDTAVADSRPATFA